MIARSLNEMIDFIDIDKGGSFQFRDKDITTRLVKGTLVELAACLDTALCVPATVLVACGALGPKREDASLLEVLVVEITAPILFPALCLWTAFIPK